MRTINHYEFIEDRGELVLMTDRLAGHPCHEPVLLVSAVDNTAYLRRAPADGYKFCGIDAVVMRRLRRQVFVTVIEQETYARYSYDAQRAPLEFNEDDSVVTKTLSVAWHRFALYWTDANSERPAEGPQTHGSRAHAIFNSVRSARLRVSAYQRGPIHAEGTDTPDSSRGGPFI
jgi:hypothetical protein